MDKIQWKFNGNSNRKMPSEKWIPFCLGLNELIVPSHNDISPSVDQTKHLLLAHSWVITTSCRLYFTNIAVVQNVAVSKQIWVFEVVVGMLLVYQNTTMRLYGAWIKRYCISCSKNLTPCTFAITSLRVRDKPLGASASVKRVYCNNSRSDMLLLICFVIR